jgi:hypothetical protein
LAHLLPSPLTTESLAISPANVINLRPPLPESPDDPPAEVFYFCPICADAEFATLAEQSRAHPARRESAAALSLRACSLVAGVTQTWSLATASRQT